ncbi:twin-arginine translocation signal domain-containing protein [Amycolatopsis anabasis]|uniref:twin-arginine translocation signal domain-containing protein n=1 Tax=Amycolatopsis anabasis TaxID=1840409 RepID=UPI00131C8C3B|nr:twin-arginine translocation signal domain-containing protein [Amycolatopsis anabasis]
MSVCDDNSSAGGLSRRGFFTAAAVAGGTAALGLTGVPAAWGDQAAPTLPAVGSEFAIKLTTKKGEKGVLVFTTDTGKPESRGVYQGRIKVRVEANPDNPKFSRKLRTLETKLHADLREPGNPVELTDIRLDWLDEDEVAAGRLRLVSGDDRPFKLILATPLVIELQRANKPTESLVASNRLKLNGSLANFPPRGAVLRLAQPVKFHEEGQSEEPLTLRKFPVNATQL